MNFAPPDSPTVPLALEEPPTSLLALDFDPENVGRTRVVVSHDALTLGSSARADVTIADNAISGVHCEVSVVGACLRVKDLGSRNGVFVNGARVFEAFVAVGGRLTLGRKSGVVVPVETSETGDLAEDEALPEVAGRSHVMRVIAGRVRRFARYRAPVLILGETGVGKERIARALHEEGPRKAGPFVVINVAALPRELIESELFGHERGAFTGAVARKRGAFEEAEGGTLFLDEIGDLPLDAQPKLLRALDGYEVRMVGGQGSGRKRDVRIVAATHVSLPARVEEGRFRRDLFHRLEVFTIEVPPLRDRREDVPEIARALLRELQSEVGRREFSMAALDFLREQEWRGNVRELRNIVFRAADLAAPGVEIGREHLRRAVGSTPPAAVHLTRRAAEEALSRCHGNLSEAARLVGVPRTTFRRTLLALAAENLESRTRVGQAT